MGHEFLLDTAQTHHLSGFVFMKQTIGLSLQIILLIYFFCDCTFTGNKSIYECITYIPTSAHIKLSFPEVSKFRLQRPYVGTEFQCHSDLPTPLC